MKIPFIVALVLIILGTVMAFQSDDVSSDEGVVTIEQDAPGVTVWYNSNGSKIIIGNGEYSVPYGTRIYYDIEEPEGQIRLVQMQPWAYSEYSVTLASYDSVSGYVDATTRMKFY